MSEQLSPTSSGSNIYGHQTNIDGNISTGGALANMGTVSAGRDIIGRDQIIFAAGIATHTAPPLDEALAQLATLPTNDVPPVTALPAGSWMPLPVNPFFVGREAELRALAAAFKQQLTSQSTANNPGHTVAATGLGGIGKTQLASTFVHRYGCYFLGGVFWLSFADPTAVGSEVAQCAAWMSDLPPSVIHLPIPDQIQIVRRAWQEPLPRLLVFDNCEDPELLAQWRPTIGGCRILITSRRARWIANQVVTAVPVGTLPREESIALLNKFAPRPTLSPDHSTTRLFTQLTESQGKEPDLQLPEVGWHTDVLNEIATELGDLPLALHMAGSYLAHVAYDVSPTAYLTELRRLNLLNHPSLQDSDFAPIEHRLHIGRTFTLSYAQLDEMNRPTDATARHLLACAACFAPGEPVPRYLLRAAADLIAEDNNSISATALARLVNLGLLEELTGGNLRLHRLLQHFVANKLSDTLPAIQRNVEATILAAAKQINASGDPRPLLIWQPQLHHITTQAKTRPEETAASLCNELGLHLYNIGDYRNVRSYYERAFAIREQVFGLETPITAQSLNNIGEILEAMGDYTAAREHYERALTIRRTVLGEMHADTAQSLNNLGYLLQAIGDYTAAREHYEHALTIRRTVLGEMHADTAQSLNNLGYLLQAIGNYTAARHHYEQALAIHRTSLSETHPVTASSLNNLGGLSQAIGDYREARRFFEQSLAIRRIVLGEEHPVTAQSRNNLGNLLQIIGEYAAAQSYYEQALTTLKTLLGEEHPATALTLNNLGGLLQAIGDYTNARTYYERALTIRLAILGKQHPATAQSYNNLGRLLQAIGDYTEAHAYYKRALDVQLSVLGENHPDTAQSLNNLGNLLQTTSDYPRARGFYEQALAIRLTVLGKQHADTAQSLNNLGVLTYYEGRTAAQAYLEQALAIYTAQLGDNHPDTQRTLGSLTILNTDLTTPNQTDHN